MKDFSSYTDADLLKYAEIHESAALSMDPYIVMGIRVRFHRLLKRDHLEAAKLARAEFKRRGVEYA